MERRDGFRTLTLWIVRMIILAYVVLSIVKLTTDFKFASFLQVALFGIYLIDVQKAVTKKGPLWEGSLFLYAFFLFLLSRVFLDFIDVRTMYKSDRFAWYTISEETTSIILTSYIIFLICFYIYLSFTKNQAREIYGIRRFQYGNNPGIENMAGTILLITLPIGIIYEGYLALTQSRLSSFIIDNSLPSAIAIIAYIATFTIPVYFCSLPEKNNRKIIFILIGLFYLVVTLQGTRSTIILFAAFFLWYELSIGRAIKTRTIISVAVVLVSLFLVVTFVRESADYFSNDGILVKVLYSAGGTHMVFANFIDYRSQLLNDTPFYFLSGILQPLVRYIFNRGAFITGRNATMAAASFSMDHKLMYALAPAAYASGRGFGSNLIAEFWACGGFIGVAILGFLYVWFVHKVEKSSYNNRFIFIFQFYMIQEFIWSPRGTALPNVIFVLISYIIFIALSQIACGKVVIKEQHIDISDFRKESQP